MHGGGCNPDLQAFVQQYLGGEIHPERVLMMTNNPLFHLLDTSTKISVEGTYTIVPSYWKQFFILQVCEEGKTVNFAFVKFSPLWIVKYLLKLAPKQIQSAFFDMISPKMGVQMLLFSDRGVQKDLESHLLHEYNFTTNYKMCSLNRFEVTLVAFFHFSLLCKCLFKVLASRHSQNFTLIAQHIIPHPQSSDCKFTHSVNNF